MNIHRARKALGLIAAVVAVGCLDSASAAVLGYDGFVAGTNNALGEYIANPGTQTDGRYRLTDGQNPVISGFSGSWTNITGMFEMGATPGASLAYSDGTDSVTNTGNAVFRGYEGSSSRALDNGVLGLGQSGVRYVSFMMQLETTNTEARIDFGEAAFQDWGQLGIRVEGGEFKARFAGQTAVSMGAVDTDTHLFVWKVEVGSTQKAYLYMDPVLSSEGTNTPVSAGTVSLGTYDPTHITLTKRPGSNGDDVTFDEIRIGESWADVVVLDGTEPEPDLLSYDGFVAGTNQAAGEYIANPGTQTDGRYRLTDGQNPVISGYAGSWTNMTGEFEMGATPAASLVYNDGSHSVSNSGNAVFRGYPGQSSRALDNSVLRLGEAGTTRYVSFMMQLDTTNLEARIDFGEAAFQDWGQLGIRVEGGQFNARFAGQTAVSMGAVDTDTHFFVWKVEAGSSQKAYLYMDPVLSSEGTNTPVLVGTVSAGTYDPTHVTLSKRTGSDGDAVTLDEIRIGKTWAAVTTVTETTPVLTPYEQWAQSYNLSGTNALYSANPDGDRLNNLYEWALGGDPTNSLDQGISPTYDTALDAGTNWFVYVYPSNSLATNLVYYLETDTDLVNAPGWTNDFYEVVAVGPSVSDFNYVTNRLSTEADDQQFIRLVVEEAP